MSILRFRRIGGFTFVELIICIAIISSISAAFFHSVAISNQAALKEQQMKAQIDKLFNKVRPAYAAYCNRAIKPAFTSSTLISQGFITRTDLKTPYGTELSATIVWQIPAYIEVSIGASDSNQANYFRNKLGAYRVSQLLVQWRQFANVTTNRKSAYAMDISRFNAGTECV